MDILWYKVEPIPLDTWSQRLKHTLIILSILSMIIAVGFIVLTPTSENDSNDTDERYGDTNTGSART